MGMDLTVLVVDWAHLEGIAADDRLDSLREAVYPDKDPEGPDGDRDPLDGGWVRPTEPYRSWLGRYEFHGTLGSYKAHFWTAHAWDHVREAVPAGPRGLLDDFLGGLIWWGPDPHQDLEHVDSGMFPAPEGAERRDLLIARDPDTTARLAHTWQQARSVLARVHEPYRLHGPRDNGWITDATGFSRLVTEWGAVTDEAYRRGWGVIGLPW
ncbi:hypothetical protein ABT354_13340 [Streptomyces sp. NPDC000594]|uniref:hypothetical protein n=1 Tax=Streptomyces sp. NPDC000594 TaxID=3154261 RepID=UPI00332E5950